jgi:hypothetical protein
MQHELQLGYRVFLADGADSVGVIRGVSTDTIVVLIEIRSMPWC